jgi:hypothetical protein
VIFAVLIGFSVELVLLVAFLEVSPASLKALGLVFAAVAVVCDAGLRRAGFYRDTEGVWPAAWRAVKAGRREESPYRDGEVRGWEQVSQPGAPWWISVLLVPLLARLLLWLIAAALSVGDFGEVSQGHRAFPLALASLLLCVGQAALGVALLVGAFARKNGIFFACGGLALGLDGLLATVAIPCSDNRGKDVRVALAGLVLHGLLVLGFSWSQWRRRGRIEGASPPAGPA